MGATSSAVLRGPVDDREFKCLPWNDKIDILEGRNGSAVGSFDAYEYALDLACRPTTGRLAEEIANYVHRWLARRTNDGRPAVLDAISRAAPELIKLDAQFFTALERKNYGEARLTADRIVTECAMHIDHIRKTIATEPNGFGITKYDIRSAIINTYSRFMLGGERGCCKVEYDPHQDEILETYYDEYNVGFEGRVVLFSLDKAYDPFEGWFYRTVSDTEIIAETDETPWAGIGRKADSDEEEIHGFFKTSNVRIIRRLDAWKAIGSADMFDDDTSTAINIYNDFIRSEEGSSKSIISFRA